MFDSIKNIWFYVKQEALAFLIVIFAPIVPSLMFVGLLIVVDLITKLVAVKHKYGWQGITSKKMGNGMYAKLIIYPLIIIIASASKSFFPAIPFVKGAVFLLLVVEFKSISENVEERLNLNLFGLIKTYITKGRKEAIEEIEKEK